MNLKRPSARPLDDAERARLAAELPAMASYLTPEWHRGKPERVRAARAAIGLAPAFNAARDAAREALAFYAHAAEGDTGRFLAKFPRYGRLDCYEGEGQILRRFWDDAGLATRYSKLRNKQLDDAALVVRVFLEGLQCLETGLCGGVWGEVRIAAWEFDHASLLWRPWRQPQAA